MIQPGFRAARSRASNTSHAMTSVLHCARREGALADNDRPVWPLSPLPGGLHRQIEVLTPAAGLVQRRGRTQVCFTLNRDIVSRQTHLE